MPLNRFRATAIYTGGEMSAALGKSALVACKASVATCILVHSKAFWNLDGFAKRACYVVGNTLRVPTGSNGTTAESARLLRLPLDAARIIISSRIGRRDSRHTAAIRRRNREGMIASWASAE